MRTPSMSPRRVIAVVLVCVATGGCATGPQRHEIESLTDCRRLVAAPVAPPPPAPSADPDPIPLGGATRLRLLGPALDRSHLPQESARHEDPLDPPLDPADPRVQSYVDKIKQRIEANWVYPREAIRQQQAGSGTIVFVVKQDGQLGDVTVVRSTGADILDRYMVGAIQLAAPFARFPCRVTEGAVPVTMNFNYKLGMRAR